MAPAKKKDTHAPLVPKLRFKEFAEDGEWEDAFLGNCSTVVRGGSPRPIDDFFTSEKNGLNWLKIGDVDKDAKYITHTKERVVPEALNKSREINSGDLILSNSMSFGRPYISKIKACIHDGWIAITEINEKFDIDFIYYLILSPLAQNFFITYAAGSGVQNLNADIIKSLRALFPKKQEQQRIADCLTSLDENITAESQKLEALTTHKKTLMQKLFPAEGEKVPALRFKEFTGAGEWVEKRLGENTLKVGSGITPTGGDKNYIKSGRPFVRSQNVGWGQLLLDDIVSISDEIHKTFLSSEIKNNDVLLNITGASIGRCALADSRIEKGNVNQHVCIIRTKTIKLLPVYLCHYILSKYGQKQIDSFQAGGNRQGLNFEQIKSFMIPFPQSKKAQKETHDEQQRIADCLTSIDEYITAQAHKIALLKEHKKGLMQQLFPRMEEENV